MLERGESVGEGLWRGLRRCVGEGGMSMVRVVASVVNAQRKERERERERERETIRERERARERERESRESEGAA